MQKYKDPKEMRLAINGRMITMISGIFIITTALFTTLRYGIGLFQSAGEAAKGNQEVVAAMEQVGVGVGYLRFTSIFLILLTMFEVFVGVFALRLCNRLDKTKLTLKLCIALLAAEIILQPIVLRTQMMMLSNLLMPLCLLWGVLQLRKLAKLYPDRIFTVEQNAGRNNKKAPQAPKKSLMARAMVQAKDDVEEVPAEKTQVTEKFASETEEVSAAEESASEVSPENEAAVKEKNQDE